MENHHHVLYCMYGLFSLIYIYIFIHIEKDHFPSVSHVSCSFLSIAIALDPSVAPQVALPQGVSFDAEQQRYTVATGDWHHTWAHLDGGDFYDDLERVLDQAFSGIS